MEWRSLGAQQARLEELGSMAGQAGRWKQAHCCTGAYPAAVFLPTTGGKTWVGESDSPAETSVMWPRPASSSFSHTVRAFASIPHRGGMGRAMPQNVSPFLVSRDLCPSVAFSRCSLTHLLLFPVHHEYSLMSGAAMGTFPFPV